MHRYKPGRIADILRSYEHAPPPTKFIFHTNVLKETLQEVAEDSMKKVAEEAVKENVKVVGGGEIIQRCKSPRLRIV